MISYPAFTQQGVIVKTLFDPTISFGSLVQVKSSLLSAIASAQPTPLATVIASTGQFKAHAPHSMQASRSTIFAGLPST